MWRLAAHVVRQQPVRRVPQVEKRLRSLLSAAARSTVHLRITSQQDIGPLRTHLLQRPDVAIEALPSCHDRQLKRSSEELAIGQLIHNLYLQLVLAELDAEWPLLQTLQRLQPRGLA